MERGLQKANHYNQLAEWAQRVEACRRSGQKLSEWCSEQGSQIWKVATKFFPRK